MRPGMMEEGFAVELSMNCLVRASRSFFGSRRWLFRCLANLEGCANGIAHLPLRGHRRADLIKLRPSS